MTLQEMDAEIAELNRDLDSKRSYLKHLVRLRDEALLRAEVDAMDPAARERLKKALGF